jgi:hypothetical protein
VSHASSSGESVVNNFKECEPDEVGCFVVDGVVVVAEVLSMVLDVVSCQLATDALYVKHLLFAGVYDGGVDFGSDLDAPFRKDRRVWGGSVKESKGMLLVVSNSP